jgi:hypothetical protein
MSALYLYWRLKLNLFTDPRTKDWFPATDFRIALVVVVTYLLVCLVFGPMYMKNRPPMQLTKILTCYNLTMVLVSAYVSYEVLFFI